MDKDFVFERVVTAILQADKGIQPELIRNDASLVSDLGMDSMRLAALFGEIKRQFGPVDMTGWYISAARHGSDTVFGLVDYLYRTLKNDPSAKSAISQ